MAVTSRCCMHATPIPSQSATDSPSTVRTVEPHEYPVRQRCLDGRTRRHPWAPRRTPWDGRFAVTSSHSHSAQQWLGIQNTRVDDPASVRSVSKRRIDIGRMTMFVLGVTERPHASAVRSIFSTRSPGIRMPRFDLNRPPNRWRPAAPDPSIPSRTRRSSPATRMVQQSPLRSAAMSTSVAPPDRIHPRTDPDGRHHIPIRTLALCTEGFQFQPGSPSIDSIVIPARLPVRPVRVAEVPASTIGCISGSVVSCSEYPGQTPIPSNPLDSCFTGVMLNCNGVISRCTRTPGRDPAPSRSQSGYRRTY